MRNKLQLTLFFILMAVMVSACSNKNTSTGTPPPNDAGIANPASVNCTQKGGRLEIRQDAKGEYGVCMFADGRQCEEWVLYRDDKCVPAK